MSTVGFAFEVTWQSLAVHQLTLRVSVVLSADWIRNEVESIRGSKKIAPPHTWFTTTLIYIEFVYSGTSIGYFASKNQPHEKRFGEREGIR